MSEAVQQPDSEEAATPAASSRRSQRSRQGSRRTYYKAFSLGLGNLTLLLSSFLFLPLGLWAFQQFGTTGLGWGLGLGSLALAAWSFVALLYRPLSIRFSEDQAILSYPFRKARIPYKNIERLHYTKRPSRSDPRKNVATLRIETKHGKNHWIGPRFGSYVPNIAGYLEEKVYGRVL
ncbi:MAG: hypothetical protein ACOCVG_02130 [Verrucomicrobiota bacterium]